MIIKNLGIEFFACLGLEENTKYFCATNYEFSSIRWWR